MKAPIQNRKKLDVIITEDRNSGKHRPDTVIDASLDIDVIQKAVKTHFSHLKDFLYKADLSKVKRNNFPKNIGELEIHFDRNLKKAMDEVVEIVYGINQRAYERRSKDYLEIISKDRQNWEKDNKQTIEFGVIACVDKGIPFEAVCGVDGQIGRTLGGDVEIEFINSLNDFYLTPSAISKRIIHLGRSGVDYLVEPLIEHTGCGRRSQIMGNEFADNSIPSEGFVFENIQILAKNFPKSLKIKENLNSVNELWKSYQRKDQAAITPDQGLFSGIIFKMAQRQAFYNINELKIISPIEIYDKENGDLIAGIDDPCVLSDSTVLKEKGYTKAALSKLISENKIFSLTKYHEQVSELLSKQTNVPKFSSKTYSDLQKSWVSIQEELVKVTNSLWELYDLHSEKNNPIQNMANDYLKNVLYHKNQAKLPEGVIRRLIHHIFHCYAFTYLLGTFKVGNVPGKHIESYLATGDHDTGAKLMTPLGQGDLARPSASEMFTQYVVLQHSDGLAHDMPIIATIKQDTDRNGDQAISTEESNVAQEDLKEFMKLWPYFMVGDLIPVSVIRGKTKGGVSRLSLSILLSLHNMAYLLESKKINLPSFVPANTPSGEVVMVPGVDILQAGLDAKGDLHAFRHNVQLVALQYANRDIQLNLSS